MKGGFLTAFHFLFGYQNSMPYADIIFNLRINKSFTYFFPATSHFDLKPGQRVLVPFGKRELTGIVINVKDTAPELEYKEIIDVLDDSPLLSQ